MSVRKLAMVAALGASLASAPVVAQTQAAPLSVAAASSTTALQSDQDVDDGGLAGVTTTTYVIAFFVVIVIAIGIYFAFDDDEGAISA